MKLHYRTTVVVVCVLFLVACGATESGADPENAAESEPTADPGANVPSSSEQGSDAELAEAPDPQAAEELAAKWLAAAKKGDLEYLMSISEIRDAEATRSSYERLIKDFAKRSYNVSVEKAFTKPELQQWFPKWLVQIGEAEEYNDQGINRALEKFQDQDLFVVVLDKSKSGLRQLFPTLVFRGTGSDLRFVELMK